MRRPRFRFSVRAAMVAVAILASLLPGGQLAWRHWFGLPGRVVTYRLPGIGPGGGPSGPIMVRDNDVTNPSAKKNYDQLVSGLARSGVEYKVERFGEAPPGPATRP